MNLSMLLFNEESLSSSQEAAKSENSKSFICTETVEDFNEDSMDALSAEPTADRSLSTATGDASALQLSVPDLSKTVTEFGKSCSEPATRVPVVGKPVFSETRRNLVQQKLFFNGAKFLHQTNSFTRGLAITSKQQKTKREWRNIGTFTSEEAMNEVRKREKVSKRKTVIQINGTKVFYRCNNWRRTSCNYRMHAIIHASNHITLYASGEHDHTTKNPHYVPRTYAGSLMYHIAPCSSQEQVLNQFVANATGNSSQLLAASGRENAVEKVEESTSSPQMQLDAMVKGVKQIGANETPKRQLQALKEVSYRLSDGPNVAALLQVAAELGHSFKFNSRGTGEYSIESNKPVSKGKMLVFVDRGIYVSVIERLDGSFVKSEEWRKADWHQFLYAVRGKCRAVLF